LIEVRRNAVRAACFVTIYSAIPRRKRAEEEIRCGAGLPPEAPQWQELKTKRPVCCTLRRLAALGAIVPAGASAHEIKEPAQNFVTKQTSPFPLGRPASTDIF